jgi:hypothetical protein
MAATALERTVENKVITLLQASIPDIDSSCYHAGQSDDELAAPPRVTVEVSTLGEFVTRTGVFRVQCSVSLENHAKNVAPDTHDNQWAWLVSVFAASSFPSSMTADELKVYPIYRRQTSLDRSENSWRNTLTAEFCACLNRTNPQE